MLQEEQANKIETLTFASVRWPNFLNASFKSPSVVVHERLPTKQRYSSASDIFNQLSCGVKQTCKVKNMIATSRKKGHNFESKYDWIRVRNTADTSKYSDKLNHNPLTHLLAA